MKSKEIINLLGAVAYEVIRNHVSIDVAFKRVCKGKCARNLNEREYLYSLCRDFISNYVKLKCLVRKRRVSFKSLARLWLKLLNNEVTTEGLSTWCELSINKWFFEKLTSLVGEEEAIEVVKAMNKRVWWLRVNTLLTNEEKVIKELEREGAELLIDKDYPYMLKLLKSPKPVRLLKPVKEFKVIPQDKASAAVVESLNPEPNDVIVDLTAAPGIKTSLIMMLTENKARVIAVDVSLKRIKIMKSLLRKLGVDLSKVELILSDGVKFKLRSEVDKLLLDAPCSNSGAVSKDPALKVLISEDKVRRHSILQKKLIVNAVKLSSYVVYSTCSLMPEEGEYVIEYVIESCGNIRLERPIKWAETGYKCVSKVWNLVSRLMPHKHGTEGFFVAKLIRD